jgi:hypothetical protein
MHISSPLLLLMLWPTSILGLGSQGESFGGINLIFRLLEFGGNALIYGVLGSIVGAVVGKLQDGKGRH